MLVCCVLLYISVSAGVTWCLNSGLSVQEAGGYEDVGQEG